MAAYNGMRMTVQEFFNISSLLVGFMIYFVSLKTRSVCLLGLALSLLGIRFTSRLVWSVPVRESIGMLTLCH
ncbi:hypothetical protein PVAP13_9NG359614 [Panicum virgatum]|uniref:Uncharacterized protein n=1 Tax=Panicum virgatum TaxID=38727 RepID=A0A8T0MQL3_PANVG|nr:hypothetical protein PVAP13_9NG359614 [Panicum virgatum]KAG2538783.1 hypothetical protein PVAP13_9NG359614 [Panicum virgatum]